MAIQHDPVEIVTVGAGWTATMIAAKVCPGGTSMVSLEQGPTRFAYPEFAHNHDGLRYSNRYAMMVNLRHETWTWRPDSGAPSLPMRQYGTFNPGQGLGGAAIHWSGQLWRFLPYDFEYRTHHVERYGEDRLPAGSTIQDWPVSYEELEPYYDAFEWDVGVSGEAGNIEGRRQERGNPHEGPRSRGYPNPPLALTAHAENFGRACEQLGYDPFIQPAGITSRAWEDPYGNKRAGCLYCGFCTRYGCEVDAKASPVNTHLPVAIETGNYEVRANAKVTRVEVDDTGKATGVTYLDGHGEEHFQPADTVILSAFTLENVRLLLLSRSRRHPDGIGNDRGMVGKNFTYQLFGTPVKGDFGDRKLNMYMGNTCTIKVIYDYYGDEFDHGDLDFIGGSQIFSEPCERQPITSAYDFESPSGRSWGAEWKEALRSWDSIAAIGIQGESLPYEGQALDLDPNYRDRLGNPLLRLTFDWQENEQRRYRFLAARCREIMERMRPSKIADYGPELDPFNIVDYKTTHPTGGAIMGESPERSVTNDFGQVWDTPNVFVTGAALYPQNPGANPTNTLAALAYRTGEALAGRYTPGEPL